MSPDPSLATVCSHSGSGALPATHLHLAGTWLLSTASSVSRGASQPHGRAIGHTPLDGQGVVAA